jgi:hypothetical protein
MICGRFLGCTSGDELSERLGTTIPISFCFTVCDVFTADRFGEVGNAPVDV